MFYEQYNTAHNMFALFSSSNILYIMSLNESVFDNETVFKFFETTRKDSLQVVVNDFIICFSNM